MERTHRSVEPALRGGKLSFASNKRNELPPFLSSLKGLQSPGPAWEPVWGTHECVIIILVTETLGFPWCCLWTSAGYLAGKAPMGEPSFLRGLARVRMQSGHRNPGNLPGLWRNGHKQWLGVGRTYSCIPERNSASISRDGDLPLDFCFKDENLTISHKSVDTGHKCWKRASIPTSMILKNPILPVSIQLL